MGRKKKASFGVLFWIACILFILVLFLFNKKNIDSVLQSTNFIEVVQNKMQEQSDSEEISKEVPEGPSEETSINNSEEIVSPESVNDELPTSIVGNNSLPEEESVQDTTETDETSETESSSDQPEQEPEIITEPTPETRKTIYPVYFISVNDDSSISMKKVQRLVEFVDSPMTATINKLLEGPSLDELNSGLISVVPEGASLITASVSQGTAYLNFNDAFMFNALGKEGAVAQLKQLVYTVTEFPTIDTVQFLIDGKTMDYLGTEGVYIKKPISRSML